VIRRPDLSELAKDTVPKGPNQLWVADITYIAITAGFVFLAAVLERAVEPPFGQRYSVPAWGTGGDWDR
jgi:hypothetical protein